MKFYFRIEEEPNGTLTLIGVEERFCQMILPDRASAYEMGRAGLSKYLSRLSPELLTSSPYPGTPADVAKHFNVPVEDIVRIPVDPATALAIRLRRCRSMRGWHQADMARRLGMKSRSAYQRLEDPLRTNPTLDTLMRLKRLLPELDLPTIFAE